MAAETYRIEIPIEVKDNTEPGVGQATKKVTGFEKAAQKAQERLNRMNHEKYRVVLDAMDKASAVIGRIGTSLRGLTSRAWKITTKAVDLVTAPVRGIINLFKNPLFQIGATIGISMSLGDSIQTYASFEQAMANAAATAGATGKELEQMNELAKKLGADTRFSASQAADAMYYMASAGWKAADMSAGLNDVLLLSAATQTELADTSGQVISTLNMYELQAKDSARVADVYTKSIGNSQATMEKLGYSMRYIGSMSNSLNWSLEETTAALSMLYDKGYEGEQAGTILRGGIAALLNPTNSVKDALAELGVQYKDINPATHKLVDIIRTLQKAEITTSQATKLFGTEAGPGMVALINTGADKLQEFTALLNDSGGNAAQMAETMNDTLSASFDELKSKVEDVQIALGERLKPHIRSLTAWLGGNMGKVKKSIGEAMDWIDEKIAAVKETIDEFTATDEWANADIWGKTKIAWDEIIAKPFNKWWNDSGRAWFTEKAQKIGEGIGGGITAGLLALLGIDLEGAMTDGKSVGGAFINGFKEGFDLDKITEAMQEWASDNKGIAVGIGAVIGYKVIMGAYRIFKNGQSLVGDIKNLLGFGGNGTPTGGTTGGSNPVYSTKTMNVAASVVNIYGSGLGTSGGGNVPNYSGKLPALPTGGGSGAKVVPGGAVATGGGLTSATGWLGRLLKVGSSSSVVGADGTLLTVTGGIGGALGKTAGALGSGATTAAGAAAAGASAVTGGVLGVAGLGSGIADIVQGTTKEGKEAKDEYYSGGSKIGMVGAGAAAGAAIGSVVPGAGTAVGALIGAGIGGVGALFGGDKVGKGLSDATDEGGWLNNTGKAIGSFFTKTLPKKWDQFWSGVGDFFTQSLPEWWGGVKEKSSNFFTVTLPEKWDGFWSGVGNFFTEQIPYAIGFTTGKVSTFFTETLPEKWHSFWDGIGNFFTETIPEWWGGIKEKASNFFMVTLPEKWYSFWDGVGSFFTETIPEWWGGIKEKASNFFTVTLPEKWHSFWDGIGNFFTETIPEWGKKIKETLTNFFTVTIPEKWNQFWSGIGDFFTETIPNWWSNLKQNVVGWFGSGYNDATQGKGFNPAPHAWGGIMTTPHIGLVAEQGAESIIPLAPEKRARGRDLWMQTGQMLGVPAYAEGGIFGDDGEEESPVPLLPGGQGGTPAVNVQMEVNPVFQIEGGADEETIVAIIKARLKEMVDDISDELAERLTRIFANLPVKA